MTAPLSKIYSETLIAQIGMQTLSDALGRGQPPAAMWNEVEEAMEAALDGFRVFRKQCRAMMPKNSPSPGFAGAYKPPQADLAPTTPDRQPHTTTQP